MAPDILAARRGVPVRRFGRLHRRCPGGVGAGSLTGLVARLLTLLPHPPHGHRARRAGLLHLLDQGLDLLDDSLLFGLGIFTGLGLAQPLLDVPHLLDDLAKRAASLLLLAALLLTLLAGEFLELVVDLLVLALQSLILLLGFLSAGAPPPGAGLEGPDGSPGCGCDRGRSSGAGSSLVSPSFSSSASRSLSLDDTSPEPVFARSAGFADCPRCWLSAWRQCPALPWRPVLPACGLALHPSRVFPAPWPASDPDRVLPASRAANRGPRPGSFPCPGPPSLRTRQARQPGRGPRTASDSDDHDHSSPSSRFGLVRSRTRSARAPWSLASRSASLVCSGVSF